MLFFCLFVYLVINRCTLQDKPYNRLRSSLTDEPVAPPISSTVSSPMSTNQASRNVCSLMRLPIITPARRPSTHEVPCEISVNVTVDYHYRSPRNSQQVLLCFKGTFKNIV